MQRLLQEIHYFFIRFAARRLVLFSLFALSLLFLFIGRPDPAAFSSLRGAALEVSALLFDAAAMPIRGAHAFSQSVGFYWNMAEDHARLRAEHAKLIEWRRRALALEARLAAYESLLKTAPETPPTEISARIVSDRGGPYVKTLILASGERQGVRAGQAVMGAKGLAGRIIDAGHLASRVLLLTDFNSRVPVLIGKEGTRALLLGDNSPMPLLDYYEKTARIHEGAPILTSGHGGLMPPGLFIGEIVLREGLPRAALAETLQNSIYVRVLEHSLPKLDSLPKADALPKVEAPLPALSETPLAESLALEETP